MKEVEEKKKELLRPEEDPSHEEELSPGDPPLSPEREVTEDELFSAVEVMEAARAGGPAEMKKIMWSLPKNTMRAVAARFGVSKQEQESLPAMGIWGIPQEDILDRLQEFALQEAEVKEALEGLTVRKVIAVPGSLVNFVAN